MSEPSPFRKLMSRRLAQPPANPRQRQHPLSEVRIAHLVAIALMVLCWFGGRHAQALAVDEKNDWPTADGYLPVPPANTARFVSLGYNELAADISWASTLVYYGSSRVGKSDFRYLERFLDTIITLDPKFYRVYEWGAYAVLFRKSYATQAEFKSSVKYLERGIKEFPDNYKHYWQLGLRYWLDLKPKDDAQKRRYRTRAAYLIERAIHCPDAPAQLFTLAASMRTQLGQHERARRTLRQLILTTNDPAARKKMELRFRELVPPDKSKELAKAQKGFDAAWKKALPYAPPDLFVIMGEKPNPSIDFDKLATPRALFGSSDSDFDFMAPDDSTKPDNADESDAGANKPATTNTQDAGAKANGTKQPDASKPDGSADRVEPKKPGK